MAQIITFQSFQHVYALGLCYRPKGLNPFDKKNIAINHGLEGLSTYTQKLSQNIV